MRIQVTLILFPSVNLHFPNFLQCICLTLVVRKNKKYILKTDIFCLKQQKSFFLNEILGENPIYGTNKRGEVGVVGLEACSLDGHP